MTLEYATLGDVCDINPKLPKPHGMQDDDQVSFVPMAAVDERSGSIKVREVRRFADVRKGYTAFADGDVLFAKITPCMENGKAALAQDLVGGRGFGSTEFHVLRSKERVLPEWLYYFVRRKPFRDEAKRNFTGTGGQQRVPASFMVSARLPVPPLEDQRRLVDILSRAEGIVRLRREAQQIAAELIPAIFIDMFGDPARNPKGWRESRIQDLCRVATGATPLREERRYFENGAIPWVKTGEVIGDAIVDTEEKISAAAIAETNCKIFPPGTIIVAMYGQGMTRGRAAQLAIAAATNQACAAILPSDSVHSVYLFELLKTQYERLRAMGRGGNQANLNMSMIKELIVPVPPTELQAVFGERASTTRSILRQQSEALAKATATFDALLARAFDPAASL